MAEAKVGVKVTGLSDIKKLNDLLKSSSNDLRKYAQEAAKSGKASKPLVAIYSEQAAKLEKLGMTRKEAFKVAKDLYQEELKLAKATSSAAKSVDLLEKEWKQLERSINPAKAATIDFGKKLDILNRKFKDKSSVEYTKNLKLLVEQANRAGVAFNKTTGAFTQGSKGMARSGLAMQQAGYQVQDFIVQVQAGTNPLIAFAQQGSQLAGFFAGPWGAMIGVGIAGLSALAMAFMATREEAKTLSEALEDLEEATGKALDAFEMLADTDLEQKFGSVTGSMRIMTQVMLQLNSAAQLTSLVTTLDKLEESAKSGEIVKFFKGMAAGLTFGFFGAGAQQADEEAFAKLGFDMSLSTYESYVENLKQLASSGDRQGVVEAFGDFLKDATDNGAKLSDEGRAIAAQMYQAATNTAELHAQLNGSAKQAERKAQAEENFLNFLEKAVDAAEDAAEFEKERQKDRDNLVNSLRTEASMWASMYGKNKEEIKELNDEAKLHVDLLALGLVPADRQYQLAVKYFKQLQANRKETEALAQAQEDATKALQKQNDLNLDLDKEIAKATLQLELLKDGVDKSTAAFIAGEKAKLQAAFEVTKQLAIQLRNFDMVAQAAIALAEGMAKLDQLQTLRGEIGTYGGGDSKKETPQDKLRDEIAALESKQAFLEDTLYLTGDQLAIEQQLYDLRMQHQEAWTPAAQEQIRNILEQTQALEKQKQTMERLADSIANSIGNAFYDVITGAKSVEDAMRQMALNIINELFRVLVVEQMVASIKRSLMGGFGGFFADGAVFSGGNVVPFASGGVVSGPTMFPMSGNRTGLMGEAGPEAIMPLKRGSDGKLGVAANQNSEPVVNQKIINVLDPSIVGEYLGSREGEKVIMNVMRRNKVV